MKEIIIKISEKEYREELERGYDYKLQAERLEYRLKIEKEKARRYEMALEEIQRIAEKSEEYAKEALAMGILDECAILTVYRGGKNAEN